MTWPQNVFSSFWSHRRLIWRLTERELLARYRGSVFGVGWALLSPLAMLAVFTFVYGVVIPTRWPGGGGLREIALQLFIGLTVYQIVADCLSRAPRLIIDHVAYVKKVVFPLEALAWVLMLNALVTALFSLIVLLAGHLALVGLPPPTTLAIPFLVIPLALFVLGLVWIFAALGVFFRDMAVIIGPLLTALMFLTPIFYPADRVPDVLVRFNPLAYVVEWARGALFAGTLPDLWDYLILNLVGVVFAWVGLAWFNALKRSFADVV